MKKWTTKLQTQSQQKNTLKCELMNYAMNYIKSKLKPGWRIMVNLQAAKDKEGFYKKFGFIERPNEDFGPGMHQWISSEEEN